jgi:transcriptional regulator with PAS, ATPase and Fis domain
VDWERINVLHAINKLQDILFKWYGIDLFFIHEEAIELSPERIKNPFIKACLDNLGGIINFHSVLKSSIKKLSSDQYFELLGVTGVIFNIELEGDLVGQAVAYPFITNGHLLDKKERFRDYIKDWKSEQAISALNSVNEITVGEAQKIKDLTQLAAEEVLIFQKEQNKRDELLSKLSNELSSKFRYHSIIGKSTEMQEVYLFLDKIQKSESNVLIYGENGTGKELVAKAIHYNSRRSDKLFLEINCSAFNENLLDSELFGHLKGAFTGAIKDKIGIFEKAHKGTIFLDEVGETSLAMQVKILRVIQEGTYMPVGGTTPKSTDIRVICATNKDLKKLVETGAFREDLFYRLNILSIKLPPLRDREGDIFLLMNFFLKKRCDELGLALKEFGKKTKEILLDYSWPGNIRELENEIERLVVLSGNDKVILPDNISPRIKKNIPTGMSHKGIFISSSGSMKEAIVRLEIDMIKKGLIRCNYNKSRLAKELGISRAGLIMKIEKYGLEKRGVNKVA